MKSSELLRKLLKLGWVKISQEGSHIKLEHPIIKDIIIFPNHGAKEMSSGLEKTILKKAGINKSQKKKGNK